MSFVHHWAIGFFESLRVGSPARCGRPLPRELVDRLVASHGAADAADASSPVRWHEGMLFVEYASVHRRPGLAARSRALARAVVESTSAQIVDVTSTGIVRSLYVSLRDGE